MNISSSKFAICIAGAALAAACAKLDAAAIDDEDSFAQTTSAVEGGETPGPTPPPPAPACSPAECFTGQAAPLASWEDPAIEATSNNSRPAISALGNSTGAAQLTSAISSGPAMWISSNGANATALAADVLTPGAFGSTAVHAEVASPLGSGAVFVNTGGGDLIAVRNTPDGFDIFRVANDGAVWADGQLVAEYGPKGYTGAKGDPGREGQEGSPGDQGLRGERGPTGPPGPDSPANTYVAICGRGGDCIGKCKGTLDGSAEGPCYANGDFGTCEWAGEDGVCCLCGP